MGRKAKCNFCGKTIDTKESFSPTGKTPWYCNEEEYRLFMKPKWDKDEFLKEMSELLSKKWELDTSQWMILRRAISSWYDRYGNEKIEAYLDTKIKTIEHTIGRKAFEDESHKAFYILAILRNNIEEFMNNYISKKEREAVHVVDFYMPSKIKYSPTNQRRGSRILEEEGD